MAGRYTSMLLSFVYFCRRLSLNAFKASEHEQLAEEIMANRQSLTSLMIKTLNFLISQTLSHLESLIMMTCLKLQLQLLKPPNKLTKAKFMSIARLRCSRSPWLHSKDSARVWHSNWIRYRNRGTSIPIGECMEVIKDRPTDQPTCQPTDARSESS